MAGAWASFIQHVRPEETKVGSAAKGVSNGKEMGFAASSPLRISAGLRLVSPILPLFLFSRLRRVPQANTWATLKCIHWVLKVSGLSRVWLFVDCSPPGSSDYGIFQVTILEWLPFPPPGDLPNPGIESPPLGSPALTDRCLTTVPPAKPPSS